MACVSSRASCSSLKLQSGQPLARAVLPRRALAVRAQSTAAPAAATTVVQQPAIVQQREQKVEWRCGIVNDFQASQFDALAAAAGDKLLCIDVFTTWCGPCKMMAPELDKMAAEYSNVLMAKLDCTSSSENKKWAMEHKVKALPTFIMFKEGRRVNDMTGSKVNALRGLIEAHM